MSQALLRVNNLSIGIKSAKQAYTAVNDASFQLNQGEILGLVGESGCGKSLTALAIAGLLPKNVLVSSGSIVFDGIELRDIAREELQKIQGKELAMVFQEPMTSLNPLLPIGKQIGENLKIHFHTTASETKAEVSRVLTKVGLARAEELYHSYPHQLSGGMRQRVMIAMAIVCKPKLIIADEPTTALDVTIQAQILELLKEINRETKTALLFISHDLSVISGLCDRVAVMYAGSIVEEGSVRDIFIHPVHEYTKGLIDSIPDRGKKGKPLINIPGKVPSITEKKFGCAFAPRCRRAENRCFLKKPEVVVLGPSHRVCCYLAQEESEMEYARI
jgi:oligopeptide/dipeptide ABC transporter, ATP-binding protein, C-terminal domain